MLKGKNRPAVLICPGGAYIGNSEPGEEELIRVSPDRQVTKDTPPMFLWATYEDTTVSVRNTFWMADALAEAGVAVELHVYEKGEHGFSVADQSSAAAMDQVSPDVADWVTCAQRWMLKRFALKLPEKCPVWNPDNLKEKN